MKKIVGFGLVLSFFSPLLLVLVIVGAMAGNPDSNTTTEVDGVTYVEHWSNGDAYTHNLLAQRYGIKAEQLDSFLDSTGIHYDKSRINGKKLLEWQAASGLDVRAIVAIAQLESSLGTAGVATQKGANMFGYGAFDSNPDNATNFNDESAVTGLTKVTIIENKNETFKIQDDKAKKNAAGTLNTAAEGGGVTSAGVPEGYSLTKQIGTAGYIASSYPWGQCTWFVFNRGKEVGVSFDPYMGNGGQWKYKSGYRTTNIPTEHAALCFDPGQAGADSTYGHIAFVEQVKSDGSILISEANVKGLGVISYRTFDKETASQFTYVIGH